jgi:glutathione peroxidase-family protein
VQGASSIHEVPRETFSKLNAKDCYGRQLSFQRLTKKVTLIMNVADARHQTPQNINSFKEIVHLHQSYNAHGLEIVAFPSEQFSNTRTNKACNTVTLREDLGIGFHLMANTNVNGAQQHPVFALMKKNGQEIRGNFQTAFLISCSGDRCVVRRFDDKPPRALRSRVEDVLHEIRDQPEECISVPGHLAAQF